jgi:hypothetical protein
MKAPKARTLDDLRTILLSCAKNGIYFDDSLFDLEPQTSLKLLDDRQVMIDAAEKILSSGQIRLDSPTALTLIKALEQVRIGWPEDQPDPA